MQRDNYFGQNSFVCACNSTFCDNVESIDYNIDKANFYQEFITSRAQYRLDKFTGRLAKSAASSSRVVFTVKRSKKFQKIFEFGGSITDATVICNFSL